MTKFHHKQSATYLSCLRKTEWWISKIFSAIALSYPPKVRVRATVKLSTTFFHDESWIKIGGYESAIVLNKISVYPKQDFLTQATTIHLPTSKGALKGLIQFLTTESPLKMIRNVLYFTLKAFSFSRYLSFCLDFFDHV